MNRKTRRMMQAEAETLALSLAATSYDYGASGHLIRVQDARAVAALRQGYAAMLRQGGQPVVIQITKEAARGFPRGGLVPDALAGLVRTWLAVGLDRAGNATYTLQHFGTVGLSEDEMRDLAEVRLLEKLAVETNRSGFPGVRA